MIATGLAAEIHALELALARRDRSIPGGLDRLIADDFRELGPSGRTWDRASILEVLATEPEVRVGMEAFDALEALEVERLGDDVALATYRLDGVLRSSTWVRRGGSWQIRFRQATPLPGGGVLSSTVEAIGRTPAVELARLTAGLPGRIVAKLDYLNPGFSKKDRIAREIVESAVAGGELRPGQPVVELTSGNTGTGLAIVCAVLGHPFVAVMSEGNSAERARMMRALGAEVVLVPQARGSRRGQVTGEDLALVDARARELTAERQAFRVDQFVRPGNRRAHEGTGAELWDQTAGCIDAFVEFVGTGGTYAGVVSALKARRAAIRGYVVEPAGAAALAGRAVERPDHRIQGGGYAMARLDLLDGVPVDGYLEVDDAEAIDVARRLAREEGIFAGFSSGAVVAAALRLLRGEPGGLSVAVVLADSGLKYLSTDLWPALEEA